MGKVTLAFTNHIRTYLCTRGLRFIYPDQSGHPRQPAMCRLLRSGKTKPSMRPLVPLLYWPGLNAL